MSLNLIYKVALPSQSWVTNTLKKRGVNERIKVLILLTNSIMQIEKPYIYIYILNCFFITLNSKELLVTRRSICAVNKAGHKAY